jgi:phosphoglycerate dehydrogenase-like enzyme
MRILFCGSGWFPVVDAIRARLGPGHELEVWDRSVPLVQALREVHVILPSNARIDAAAIAAPRDLRLIQQPAAGIDGIDLAAAAARGVPVRNAPGTNHQAVAEAALLLMLALARRVREAARAFAAGEIGGPLGFELRGRTLGIVGFGRSGQALGAVATGLGMQVRSVRSADGRDALLDMLSVCDVVSIHCPLSPQTRGLFDASAFAAMKPGALLINCARGPIIDRSAVETALASGHLGGLGLDVYWHEPWDPREPLFARDDVFTLPHLAGSTHEAFARIATIVAHNITTLT